MPIKPRLNTLNNLDESFKVALKENAGITQWNSDSIARNLYEGISKELLRLNSETSSTFDALQLEYSSGEDLSSIARTRGIERLMPVRSRAGVSEYNVYFYSETSFGNINSGRDIIIPKGTRIFPSSANEDPTTLYETDKEYVLKSNTRIQYCAVSAVTIGKSQNVSANTLTNHDFVNYAQSSQKKLKVRNKFAITNGRDIETDESLRFRAFRHYSTLVKESDGSILLSGIEVPGIENIIAKPGYFGIGTIGVFCFGPEGIVNSNILQVVQNRLMSTLPPGVKIFVSPGVSVSLDLGITIWLYSDIGPRERVRIQQEVEREIRSFIAKHAKVKNVNLSLLKENIINKVKSTVGMQSFQIENKIFNSIYVRKGYGSEIIDSGERIRILNEFVYLSEVEYLSPGLFNISLELMER